MNCIPVFKKVKLASQKLIMLEADTINKILVMVADAAVANTGFILTENKKDRDIMDVSDPNYDRLLLTSGRIDGIATDIRSVASLTDPLGREILKKKMQNGLLISKIPVPFGVIGVIYEARPNVTFDVFSLCFKSGNACILKGGSDAIHSNKAIVEIIKSVLKNNGIDQNIVALLPPGRDETVQLLNAGKYVDLIIPRGSRSLIDYVRKNASVPVIETGAGICHTYFDESGDKEKGRKIIFNAKTRRVSVCNALDCLIVHKSRLDDLDYLVGLCSDSKVVIFADDLAFRALKGKYPSELLQNAKKDRAGPRDGSISR